MKFPFRTIETNLFKILKVNFYDSSSLYVNDLIWKFIDTRDPNFPRELKNDDFIKENNNIFFYNKQLN